MFSIQKDWRWGGVGWGLWWVPTVEEAWGWRARQVVRLTSPVVCGRRRANYSRPRVAEWVTAIPSRHAVVPPVSAALTSSQTLHCHPGISQHHLVPRRLQSTLSKQNSQRKQRVGTGRKWRWMSDQRVFIYLVAKKRLLVVCNRICIKLSLLVARLFCRVGEREYESLW